MSDETEDIQGVYSPEEIVAAKDQLKSMTPERLLDLQLALARAQANQTLPEATAICFTEVYSSKGNKINITCRGISGRAAIDELADTLSYAREKYNMHMGIQPAPQVSPEVAQPEEANAPQYVPDVLVQSQVVGNAAYVPTPPPMPAVMSNVKVIDIDVSTITRERKRDGKGDFLRVRGGMFTRYGAPAYDQVFPPNLDINKMNYGIEVGPFPGMTKARVQADVDAAGKMSHAKVIQFF